jgi:hypothetical protein
MSIPFPRFPEPEDFVCPRFLWGGRPVGDLPAHSLVTTDSTPRATATTPSLRGRCRRNDFPLDPAVGRQHLHVQQRRTALVPIRGGRFVFR